MGNKVGVLYKFVKENYFFSKKKKTLIDHAVFAGSTATSLGATLTFFGFLAELFLIFTILRIFFGFFKPNKFFSSFCSEGLFFLHFREWDDSFHLHFIDHLLHLGLFFFINSVDYLQ